MALISKEVFVVHSAEQMFDLVNSIGDYKDFLPWCSRSEVLDSEGDTVTALVEISYMRVKQPFITRNTNSYGRRIEISLVDGPFEYLFGHWNFKQLGNLGCKIRFELDYSFSSKLLEGLIGAFFEGIMTSLIDSFISEAKVRYSAFRKSAR